MSSLSNERRSRSLPSLEAVQAERARRSLRAFVEQAWPQLEPATPFVPGWHLDAICEHLEAVTRGEIRNLIINVPPRHMKSLAVSVFWPAWEWITAPHTRWLYSSYSERLSIRDSLKTRRLIESAWYQARWGDRFTLTDDQNQKIRFENDKTGYRIATSVGGMATGEGGDRIVVDDPHNVQEAESELVRQGVLDWWDQVMTTRGNDPRTVARVLIMQRVHEQDLSGHLLESGQWEHLCLPAEYEPGHPHRWPRDPRQREGELLWPARFGAVEIAQLKADMRSAYAAAGQLQQRPSPAEGGLFKRGWWRRYAPHELPALVRVEHFVDSAFKTGVGNDYTVFATWGKGTDGNYYLLNVWRDRWEFPGLIAAGMAWHARGEPHWPLVVEDKASGQSAIQTWRVPPCALPVVPWKLGSDQDKRARAEGVTALIEAGRVFLPAAAPWVDEFIEEHARFPNAAHDDQVDTTVMALHRLSRAAVAPDRTRVIPVSYPGSGVEQLGRGRDHEPESPPPLGARPCGPVERRRLAALR